MSSSISKQSSMFQRTARGGRQTVTGNSGASVLTVNATAAGAATEALTRALWAHSDLSNRGPQISGRANSIYSNNENKSPRSDSNSSDSSSSDGKSCNNDNEDTSVGEDTSVPRVGTRAHRQLVIAKMKDVIARCEEKKAELDTKYKEFSMQAVEI